MKINKKYILHLGLAFTLLYAGIGSFIAPTDWISFVPDWVVKFGTTPLFALHGHGLAEILLGIWLLSGWKTKWAGLLTALDILAIILVNGFDHTVFLTTFRDVGLLAMALYLAIAD